jgi:hypothetical protein
MSYCRWSSDDFECDLYIYESVDGFQVHVASNRHVIDRSGLPPVVEFGDPDWAEAWATRSMAVQELVEDAPLEKIDLPQAGESFSFETGDEAADKVEELIALGYHVPDGVVESLREVSE